MPQCGKRAAGRAAGTENEYGGTCQHNAKPVKVAQQANPIGVVAQHLIRPEHQGIDVSGLFITGSALGALAVILLHEGQRNLDSAPAPRPKRTHRPHVISIEPESPRRLFCFTTSPSPPQSSPQTPYISSWASMRALSDSWGKAC